MAENIYDVLRSDYPQLVEQLNKNEDLCTFLRLAYDHLLHIAIDHEGDPRDIVCDVDIVLERLLKITVRHVRADREGPSLTPDSKKPSQRNMNLVRFLGVNRNVKDLALRVVTVLDRWIQEKPYRKEAGFSAIRLENARLWKNLVFTAELVLKVEFDHGVIKRMGWDEPEQLTEEEGRIIIP